jgi:ribokinase
MKKYDAVTIGHVLLDMRLYVDEYPEEDRSALVKILESGVGGCGANVAVNMQRLGLKTAVIGNIGTDDNGWIILKHLKKEGVDTSGITIKDEKSGVSVISTNREGEVKVEEFLGANEPITNVHREVIQESGWLQMSSATLSALEEASTFASQSGVVVSFDPGRGLSRLGMKKLHTILKNTDYLVLNKKEIIALSGCQKYDEGAAAVAGKYGFPVIVKASKEPTRIFTSKKKMEVKTFKVKAVDSLGAGDAFDAGFIYSIIKGKTLYEAARFANAMGAVKVTRRGADSVTQMSEIDALLKSKG